MPRVWYLLALLLATCSAAAQQAPAAPNPLEPIAHWVGGEWVATVEAAPGRQIKLIRRYEWSFDRRLIVGRSYGEAPDGRRRQTRETVFAWNADTKRIEFTDHIDLGGHGLGYIEPRDGGLYMEARIVGSPHPPWRAWVNETGDDQALRAEGLRDGRWETYGNFAYKRVR